MMQIKIFGFVVWKSRRQKRIELVRRTSATAHVLGTEMRRLIAEAEQRKREARLAKLGSVSEAARRAYAKP